MKPRGLSRASVELVGHGLDFGLGEGAEVELQLAEQPMRMTWPGTSYVVVVRATGTYDVPGHPRALIAMWGRFIGQPRPRASMEVLVGVERSQDDDALRRPRT